MGTNLSQCLRLYSHLQTRRKKWVRTVANDYVYIGIYRPEEKKLYEPQTMSMPIYPSIDQEKESCANLSKGLGLDTHL